MIKESAISEKWKHFPIKRELRIASLFGESRGDHFHNGIDFAGVQNIYPTQKSAIIFYFDEAEQRTQQPRGTGNVLVLQDTNNIRSYYYHLRAGSVSQAITSLSNEATYKVTPNTPLGVVGNSGYSLGPHLHYVVEEFGGSNSNHDGMGRLVNPLQYLPDIPDKTKPLIYSAFTVHNNKGYRLYHNKRYQTGFSFNLHMSAWDLRHYFNPNVRPHLGNSYGVKTIVFSVDGVEKRRYDFSYLDKTDKGLAISGYLFSDVYWQRHSYKIGSFTPTNKVHQLDFTSVDWQGNATKKSLKLFFIKPKRKIKR